MLSKIFVKNIKIPEKVQVLFIKDNVLNFIGPSGGIVFNFHYFLKITVSEGFIFISGSSERLAILNTIVSLIKNIFYGIVNGYEKKLKLVGVGYKVVKKDNKLFLSLGFSHLVEYIIPMDVFVTVVDHTIINVKGLDKQRVGQVAAEIREKKVPDSYKGKGIRYIDEIIILKEVRKKK